MKKIKVRITFTEAVLGTWPSNHNIAQPSNGIDKPSMELRRHSHDKRSKGKAIHRKATEKHGIDVIRNGKKRKEIR